jgi:putative ABC transport system permease protein
MAVNPAAEMRDFFDTFLAPLRTLLVAVTILVGVVAAIGILVSIYNSVAARRREVAILRSLGATRRTVLLLVTLEAVVIGTVGAILGALTGHALAAGVSEGIRRQFGEGLAWWTVSPVELLYLVGVILLAALAGLVPALKAYGTPVAQHLTE